MKETKETREKPRPGVKSAYDEKYIVPWVKGLARKGATNEEIAAELNITPMTLYNWQNAHPELREAIKEGKAIVDYKVEESLLNRALGMTVTEKKTITGPNKSGETSTRTEVTEKQLPPDTTACLFWLKNRKPAEWRDNPVVDVDQKTLDAVANILDGVKNAIE